MASLALHLKSHHHHKPSLTLLKSTPTSFTHFFSSSSSSSDNNNNNNYDDNGEKQYPFSGYFKDIKSKLKQHEQQQQQSPAFNKPSPFSFTLQDSSNSSKKPQSFEEIKKNLTEFRRRSSSDNPPPSSLQQQQQSNLFQNVHNGSVGNPKLNASNVQNRGGNLSFDAIRESLRQMKGAAGEKGIGNSNMSDKMSLNNYKKSLKLQQPMTMPASGGGAGAKVIGGSFENLPESVFGREMREKERKEQGGGSGGRDALDIQLLKSYNYDELGDKLRELRPEMKEKKSGEGSWFSLSELNERVKKLKEIEEKQMNDDKISGAVYVDLKRSLRSLKDENDNKSKTASMQGFNMLPSSSFTQSPPKEHLIAKYFHPDNMSAEEKLKLELKKVRDEFKIHESDCGSTRVQIAQLTTEILHLSSVLHKKDKHSRKGLQAKVQQRKKLLKYLRRTDWESYIFVLSKLGLRDNPDYKN